jgi:glycerol kinase
MTQPTHLLALDQGTSSSRGMVFDRCNLANESRQAFDRALQISNGNYCRAKVQLGVQAFVGGGGAAAEAAPRREDGV